MQVNLTLHQLVSDHFGLLTKLHIHEIPKSLFVPYEILMIIIKLEIFISLLLYFFSLSPFVLKDFFLIKSRTIVITNTTNFVRSYLSIRRVIRITRSYSTPFCSYRWIFNVVDFLLLFVITLLNYIIYKIYAKASF